MKTLDILAYAFLAVALGVVAAIIGGILGIVAGA